MKKKLIKPNPLFVALIKLVLLPSLRKAYNIEIVDKGNVSKLSPPFMLLSNHVSFWDPFWIGENIPRAVQYVASDNIFRTPFFGLVMKLTGSIPKSKFMSDAETVGHILRVLKNRGVVGLFPEGRRTYDGRTLDLMYPVTKLIRKLKLPVVRALIKGGFLSKPRWASQTRIGKITLEYELLFKPEDLSKYSADEIHKIMSEKFSYDELNYQKKVMVPFKGKNLAEYLERFLFACPHCHSLSTLYSRNDLLTCTNCGYSVRYNEYGFLERMSEKLYFNNPANWNVWQLGLLRQIVEENKKQQSDRPLLAEKHAILLTGYKTKPLKKLSTGDLFLYYNRLEFKPRLQAKIIFSMDKILGVNVQNKEKLEFYSDNNLYRCDFLNIRASSYHWLKAIQILKE